MTEYIQLDFADVALAATLIFVNGIISVALKLKLEKTLLLASVRTVCQLLLVGWLLDRVFQLQRLDVVLLIMLVMTIIAGLTAAKRSQQRFKWMRWIAVLSVWASAWLVTGFALLFVFRDLRKWYEPQYAIPLLGMVLGNTLNGISVGLSTLTESLKQQRSQVESLLSVGATRHEAAAEPMRQAVRTGMIPIVNSMMVVGLVSLPGMMTGQLVTGMEPMQAVKYQIVIMFLIASATALGTVGVVYLSFLRLFDRSHRYRPDRFLVSREL